MIPLNFNKLDEKKTKEICGTFYKLVIENRNKAKLKIIEKWCESNLKINGKVYSFRDVVMADYEELEEIKKYIDSHSISMSGLKSISSKSKNRIYIKDRLYGDMKKNCRNYLLEMLEVTVCPYCNRNFINSAKQKNTCHFDHYFNKDSYPIFSVSFYNLIPVCPACNVIKGTMEFTYSPYNNRYTPNDLITFSYQLNHIGDNTDINSLEVKIKINNSIINDNIKALELENLYQVHRDIVLEIINKSKVFNQQYVNSLHSHFPDLFKSEAEVKQFLVGNYIEEKNYGKRPLAKMMRDIAKEVEFC